jgi:hypothetical protein
MIQNIALSAIMCLLLMTAGNMLIPTDKHKKTYLIFCLIGILLRIATVMYLYADGVDSVGTDGLLYHKVGIWISSQLDQGVSLFKVKYAYTWYTVIVGLVYHLFGINRYLVSYINIAITFFSAILLMRIALRHRYDFTNASFISLAFFFFPNLILWTADSRKEALIIFLSVLCLLCIQRYVAAEDSLKARHIQSSAKSDTSSFVIIAAICVLMWLCTLIRIYMFVPIAACALTCLFLEYRKSKRKIHLICGLTIVASSLLIFFLAVNPMLANYHAITFPEEVGNFEVDLANKVDKIKLVASNRNIITSAVNYFLMPYPGNTCIEEISSSTILNAVVSIDMLFWYVCMLFIATGIFFSIRRREKLLLGILAFIASYIVINILVVENVSDTIYRYRSVIVGPALLFIDRNVIAHMKERLYSTFRRKESGAKNKTVSDRGI